MISFQFLPDDCHVHEIVGPNYDEQMYVININVSPALSAERER